MIKKIITTICLICWLFVDQLQSQELNCQVEIVSTKLQQTDAKIFKTLEQSIFEFMNNQNWSSAIFEPYEKIECAIHITIVEELSSDKFKAKLAINASRPIHNSSYNSVLLNHIDNNFVFEYAEYQNLDYNENIYMSNLTSVLAYYAYVILGLDYDSYSQKGGTPFFNKAQAIVNSIPPNLSTDEAPGWKPYESQRNRFHLVDQLMNPRYGTFRTCSYQYHLQGLDLMYEKQKIARQVMTSALKSLQSTVEDYPNAMLVQTFFNAKSDEIVNIYSGATPAEKTAIKNILKNIDPTNEEKYSRIK